MLRHGGTGLRPGLSRLRFPGLWAGGADVLEAREQPGRLGAPARRGAGAVLAHSRIVRLPAQACHNVTAFDTGLGLRYGHRHPRGTQWSHHDEASSRSVLLATGSCQLSGFSVAAGRCQPTSRSRRRLTVNYFLLWGLCHSFFPFSSTRPCSCATVSLPFVTPYTSSLRLPS